MFHVTTRRELGSWSKSVMENVVVTVWGFVAR
jgi:hypothetical protein